MNDSILTDNLPFNRYCLGKFDTFSNQWDLLVFLTTDYIWKIAPEDSKTIKKSRVRSSYENWSLITQSLSNKNYLYLRPELISTFLIVTHSFTLDSDIEESGGIKCKPP